MHQTGSTLAGLAIVVTPDHVASARAKGTDPIAEALIAAMPDSDPGVSPESIDLIIDRRVYWYMPDGRTQEALEAFHSDGTFEPGAYAAHAIDVDPREEGDASW